MQKYISIILIIISLLAPSVLLADQPIFVDGDTGGGDTGSGTNNNSGNGYIFCSNENQFCSFDGRVNVRYGANDKFYYKYGVYGGLDCNNATFGDPIKNVAKSCYIKKEIGIENNLVVDTIKANNITQTSAVLYGEGGYKTLGKGISPLTAYFRYSKSVISPIFCNDIYGSNMIATGDIFLKEINNNSLSQSFSKQITNLSPNTTYYYCAIISNKDHIAYGGESVVKQFHTNCNTTTVETKPATLIKSTSSRLNGNYCSTKDVSLYFEYKKLTIGETSTTDWKKIGEQNYKIGNNSNLYGDLKFNLANLTPDTRYQFRAVAKNNSQSSTGTDAGKGEFFYGNTLSFNTNPSSVINNNPNNPNDPNNPNNPNNNCLPGSACSNTNTNNNTGNKTGGSLRTIPTNTGTGISTGSSGTRNTGSTSGGTGVTIGGGNQNNNGNNSGNNNGGNNYPNNVLITSNTAPLILGQITTPPNDAIVRFQEGIETVFARQITADITFAKMYGYKDGNDLQGFAWYLADEFARAFGYIDQNGKEIRVSFPDIAAYQLQLVGNKLTVYEYYDGTIIDVRNTTANFKNKSNYEYYYKK